MILRILFVVASVPALALAFAPSQHSRHYRRGLDPLKTLRETPVPLPPESTDDHDIAIPSFEATVPLLEEDTSPIFETIASIEAPDAFAATATSLETLSGVIEETGGTDSASPDVGKEIFLASLDEMQSSAKQLLEGEFDIEDGNRAFRESLKSMSRATNPPDSALEEQELLPVPPLDLSDEGSAANDVDAILAASGEAVAAAEASLSSSVRVSRPSESSSTTVAEPLESATANEAALASPSVGKILRFAVPAIGVWLCGPLLSLIDTSSVGMLSGTIQVCACDNLSVSCHIFMDLNA